ncbi:MAG: hypothetical protein DMG88_02910 [Acidobacteria bacterium]|nr:MAG: hypothetical protein DMG88_02910 [Acidobacteriota bacterium]
MFLRICILLFLASYSLSTAFAQPAVKPASQAVDNDFVQKKFGSTCSLEPGPQPLTADLNGDGVEDVVIVARCANPLMDEAEDNYKVIDPYDAFFGYGDPKVTTKFASEDPQRRGLALLIIHGVGADGWRAAEPKAKFIVINLPFKQLAVKKLTVRKKTVMAIYAEEAREGEGTVSAIFWDGKKYKYQPLGSTME